MLYAGIPLKVQHSLVGHKSISLMGDYTKAFALDMAARNRGQFSMPGADAVTMLKKHMHKNGKRQWSTVLTLIYWWEPRSMAGGRQHGWRAIPAVRSEYGADTLPDRDHSDGRCRAVRTAVHYARRRDRYRRTRR